MGFAHAFGVSNILCESAGNGNGALDETTAGDHRVLRHLRKPWRCLPSHTLPAREACLHEPLPNQHPLPARTALPAPRGPAPLPHLPPIHNRALPAAGGEGVFPGMASMGQLGLWAG